MVAELKDGTVSDNSGALLEVLLDKIAKDEGAAISDTEDEVKTKALVDKVP